MTKNMYIFSSFTFLGLYLAPLYYSRRHTIDSMNTVSFLLFIFHLCDAFFFFFLGKIHTSLSSKYTSYSVLNVSPSGQWSPTLEKQFVLEPSLENSLITSVKGYHSTLLGAQNLPVFLFETKSHL